MVAYRLYTVVGRMLELIDELTNWYIRFNRLRLKGENGPEDAVAALQTLFETLFTLARTLVSFLPFFSNRLLIPSLLVCFHSIPYRKYLPRITTILPS